MPAKIRKHQTTLICSGLAVITFGLWSIARIMLISYFQWPEIVRVVAETMEAEGSEFSMSTALSVAYGMIAFVLLVDLSIRAYVGISARAEGNGKKKRLGYVVLSILYLVAALGVDAYLLVSRVREGIRGEGIAAIIVEFTSCIAFFEIIRASLALRRYQRAERGADHAA